MATLTNSSLHAVPGSPFYRTLHPSGNYADNRDKTYPGDYASVSIVRPDWPGARLVGLNGAASDLKVALRQMELCLELYDQLHPAGETRVYRSTVREYLLREEDRINRQRRKRKKPPIRVSDLSDEECVEQFIALREAKYFKSKPVLDEDLVRIQYQAIIAERFILSWAPGESVPPEIALDIVRRLMRHPLLENHFAVCALHYNTDSTHVHIIICNATIDGTKKLGFNDTMRRELRRFLDRQCVEYGLSIIADGQLYRGDEEDDAFLELARDRVPVYENRNWKEYEKAPTRSEWKREINQFNRTGLAMSERFYFGPVLVPRTEDPERSYAIPAHDLNGNRIPDNALLLGWLMQILRGEMASLRKKDKESYDQHYKEYEKRYEELRNLRDRMERYHIGTAVQALRCMTELQQLMQDDRVMDDDERIRTEFHMVQRMLEIIENPLREIAAVLQWTRAAYGRKPTLESRIETAEQKVKTRQPRANRSQNEQER